MKVFIAILIITTSLQAQNKLYLGAAESTPLKRTAYGFNYNSNGFDRIRAKKIAKSAAYFERKGVLPYTINEFIAYSNKLGQNDFILKSIDNAWDVTKARWNACGVNSKAARIVRELDPRTIIITIEQGSFWITPNNIYANGAVMNKTTIRAVAVSMNRLSHPESAELVRFDALMLWEFGNLLAMRAGYKISSVDDEIGDRSPCEKIH